MADTPEMPKKFTVLENGDERPDWVREPADRRSEPLTQPLLEPRSAAAADLPSPSETRGVYAVKAAAANKILADLVLPLFVNEDGGNNKQ